MGLNIFLDTNAVIALLKNNTNILSLVAESEHVFISVINEIEFKSFPNLSSGDKLLFDSSAERVSVIDLAYNDHQLMAKIIDIRKELN